MLRSRLTEISTEMTVAAQEAAAAGAELVVETAKSRVPVDTGRLRDSIHTDKTPEGIFVVAGNNEVFYGHLVEHGSVEGQPPHPFLVPSLEENRETVVDGVQAAVRRAS